VVPAISNKYLTLFEVASNHLGDVDTDKFVFSNDDLAKCFGSPETEYDHPDLATELVEDIQFMNGAADEEKVQRDLAACGFAASADGLDKFEEYPWLPLHKDFTAIREGRRSRLIAAEKAHHR